MKKVILTLALAAFAFAANAQFVVSGNVALNLNGGHTQNTNVLGTTTTEYDLPTDVYNSFTFAPKVGYQLNDKMQAGLALGYTLRTATLYNAFGYMADKNYEGWTKTTRNMFTIAPYFRYNFADFGKCKLFAEAQLSFGISPKATVHEYSTAILLTPAVDTTYKANTKVFDLGLTIVPGFNYQVNEHVSLDLYVDLLGLSYNFSKSTTFVDSTVGGVTNTNETIVTSSAFLCGAQFGAQTLANHLNLFRLGFNYAF